MDSVSRGIEETDNTKAGCNPKIVGIPCLNG